MQACAVETHVKISQEPLHTEIYRKNAATQIEPRTRTHTLCEPAQSKRMSRFHTSHLMREIFRKNATPQKPRTQTVCASLRSRTACQDFTRATLYTEIYRKIAAQPRLSPERGHTLCASLRSRNACQDFTRATLYREIYRKTAAPQKLGPHFVRACAVETHVKISQEPLYREIYRKNAAPRS